MPEVVYGISCLIAGLLARRYFGGFLLWTALAAVVTPLAVMLLLIVLARPPRKTGKALRS